jgi:hypothetical protein
MTLTECYVSALFCISGDSAGKGPPAGAVDLCPFSAWVRPSHEYATTERD